MNNEQYLVVSYFSVGLMCLVLAIVAYLWLRRSFISTVSCVSSPYFSRILKKLFLIGIVLPAFFGFFSVTFRGCSIDTYEEIIAERTYLIAKNQEQLSSSLNYIIVALFAWGFIVACTILFIKKE